MEKRSRGCHEGEEGRTDGRESGGGADERAENTGRVELLRDG